MINDYKDSIIYGPLRSRRLGKSLGINILPYKTCSLDCVYCEAGATTNLTVNRESYIPLNTIIEALSDSLKLNPDTEYITICGTGEPTLHRELGSLIQHIKTKYPQYKLCLVTNSTMFIHHELHEYIALCDLIMPSLDAVSTDVFQKIDRPHPDLLPSKIIEALIEYRVKYQNTMWLEIFFLEGINDTNEELTLLREACQKIEPDLIQLNSLDRNGLYEWVKKVPQKRMLEIKEFFLPLPTMIV